ncbi:unnamed protein product [Pieris macdunnoughi]|uniref:Peptidase S1 domain-containing protein n=1 Tax=Pieris macdunnoughi TaxID=345717 RepID=A0A821N3E0_9NEOP|nr:unnamed protein product [Pieris macdunnoughi]
MYLIRIFPLFILTEINSISNVQSKDNNVTRNINQTANTTPRIVSSKRRLDRVTQKRYEIINVLWRKTKIFEDVDISIENITKRSKKEKTSSPSKIVSNAPLQRTTTGTPSYIEFYYSDLNDERIKRRNLDTKIKKENINIETRSVLNSPVFLFHVQYETCTSTKHTKHRPEKTPLRNNFKRSQFLDSLKVTIKKYNDETCPVTTKAFETKNHTKSIDILKSVPFSTAYDKIKFFELYDSDTPTPKGEINLPNIDDDEKILLEDINFDMKHENKTRYVKKHVDTPKPSGSDNENDSPKIVITNIPTQSVKTTKHFYSRTALWSEFPFIALYVYEPSQVRCDAAALSPHWLLASGSCLFRHYKSYSVNGQSAYVAYCTDNWRNSERISYVRRSFVHPRFYLRDTRRYLYNIGVIEIVNSMSETCNGWAPVSLMSHQMANTQGMRGVAVGWSLGRYPNNLSNNFSLVVYESLIYSENCPGFAEKSHKKPNVYCLSLSTSDKIENSMNGMLLIGGKLIALYSQDELSPSGEQSALYTGVWRHIPWLLDIAREPDDFMPA